MKTNVEIYTEALVKVIRDSDEYRAFEVVKGKLKDDIELMKKINQYRMDSYTLQITSDKEQLYEKTEKFYEDNSEFRENPLVEEYLSCELAICRMFQKIFSRVVGAVDLQLDDVAQGITFVGDNKS